MTEKIKAMEIEQREEREDTTPFELFVDENIIDRFDKLKREQEQNCIIKYNPTIPTDFNENIEHVGELERGVDRGIKLYDKDDAMIIFHCHEVKAMRIIKYMYQLKLAIQIGKEYLL